MPPEAVGIPADAMNAISQLNEGNEVCNFNSHV
jgi:hypothetical protein